jgi:hypothetical protein
MKKAILIFGLFVNSVIGFSQNIDTTKTEVYTFHDIVNEAFDHEVYYYELFVEVVADYGWGLGNAYNCGITWVGIDNFNLTFDYIIYNYYEFDDKGKKHIKTLKMGPREADEYFKSKKVTTKN